VKYLEDSLLLSVTLSTSFKLLALFPELSLFLVLSYCGSKTSISCSF